MTTPAAAQSPSDLWDAHTHLSWYGEAALALLVDRGVSGVRDCGGDSGQLRRWRDDIAAGRRAGPRIYFSGPALDGPKDAPHRLIVRTPAEGRAAVRRLAADGADFVKTHNALDRDTYLAILAEAAAVGLRVASHLPRGIAAWDAAEAGAASIEHAAESLVASPIYAGAATTVDEAMAWWRGPDGDKAIARLSATGVAVTPTLVTYEAFTERRKGAPDYDGRRRVLAFALELTGRLHRAGDSDPGRQRLRGAGAAAGSRAVDPTRGGAPARSRVVRRCRPRGSRGEHPALARPLISAPDVRAASSSR